MIIDIVVYNPFVLIGLIIVIGGFEIYNYYINKAYHEINSTLRRGKTAVAMVLVVVFVIAMQNIDFDINIKTIQPLQKGINVESTSTRSILVSNYVNTSYEGEQLIF
ncbi:MAG: hypothetical protein ACLRQF_10535 [Thomasclavelia ramosa]